MSELRMSMRNEEFLKYIGDEPRRANEMIRLFQRHGSELTVEEMKMAAPEKTGYLKSTIRASFTVTGFKVYPRVKYAFIVIRGVKKVHEIVSRKTGRARARRYARERGYEHPTKYTGALVFNWHGSVQFFKRVQHPGFAPRRFVEEAFEMVKTEIPRLMQQLWYQLHIKGS